MEQKEWKQIYDLYYKPLYLYALSLTKNVQDAEDLLQETFVKAFLSYKSTGSIKYWLVTVLKNEFCSMCRKRKREILSLEKQTDAEGQTENGALERLILEEERMRLLRKIMELPEKQKEILIESIYFHMTDEEIARIHSISRENVRKIRSRAKQKLIEQLKEVL